jgi:hypothetical protein
LGLCRVSFCCAVAVIKTSKNEAIEKIRGIESCFHKDRGNGDMVAAGENLKQYRDKSARKII